ncbi:unnamed protein product [Eruca vesicaria subsp. sativa]|uniref:MADS-box domain-containing protein n=1 Tax=Eruca vesicaria subsp. sativa TaxID=29727 RepID=A0ABC8IUJ2_ERUVS|nr:unnamed protein product [Eruca vesicaria subsp. sativa]
MTTKNPRARLSVRKERVFKKPSSTLCKARAATILKKSFELSELCGVEVCTICFDREGNLVWPEKEEAKVTAMAERYSTLSEQEKNKKSNNFSGFLNKKMIRDKEESMRRNDNRFSQKVLEFEDSLQSRLQTFKESLVDQRPQETPLDLSTATSSKFSLLLYNHDNGTFTQLANSASLPSFEQPINQDYLDSFLGEQGNNFDLPPMIFQQFDNEFMQQTQLAYNQIPSYGMMLS